MGQIRTECALMKEVLNQLQVAPEKQEESLGVAEKL